MGAAPLGGLAGLVDTAAWDLSCVTFDTRRELAVYCERWSAAVIAPLVRLAVPDSRGLREQTLGANLREIELLLSLAPDAHAGRLRVPLDELRCAQVRPESLAQPPWPPSLAQLLRARHRELRAALGGALDALPPGTYRALRGLIVWATMSCTASARAEARLPGASGPRDHHAPLDGWRAWRAARRVDTGRMRRAFRA
jgi:phytoene/squalene synthetase